MPLASIVTTTFTALSTVAAMRETLAAIATTTPIRIESIRITAFISTTK